MDLFSFITLFGGLTFFLYGMHVMSSGLERMAGGRLEKTLKVMTSNPVKCLLLGAGITIAMQSSSATTVMLVGLVNSGIMELSQTIGVLFGSNIGTTLTAWVLSLMGIKSDNTFVLLFKPEYFSLVIAFVGIIMFMFSKKKRAKDIGTVFVGFAVLMYGMKLMSDSVSPLAESTDFTKFLNLFNNPILGLLIGTVFTGIIQSSAASIGILQALSLTGGITYGMAIPLILGQNIGTCATAAISSIGVSKNAKRVAFIHIAIKIIGAAVCIAVYYLIKIFVDLAFLDNTIDVVGIAAVHSLFNIATTVMLFPFRSLLEKLAKFFVKSGDKITDDDVLIDERLYKTPSVVVSECESHTKIMCETAKHSVMQAISLFVKYDKDVIEEIMKKEDILDGYEDKLGTALVKISNREISELDSRRISKMLHSIGDFERLGDHAVNLVKVATEIHEKKIQFSAEANSEMAVLTGAITEILDITDTCFRKDKNMAFHVEPLEQVIDSLISQIKANHISRLQNGNCTIEMGFVLNDFLTNYERISDHCSNIAVAVIELDHGQFDTHKYLGKMKSMTDEEFKSEYDSYSAKYHISESGSAN
ncbi:MAG: Na/Pi cotransporter family protein [Clostridia bacterium]|nr:Na/Pi cotransporter family protein [Clostridia bacterium]